MNNKTQTFNANLAGMVDGAAYLLEGVQNLLKEGSQIIDDKGNKKLEVPPAYFEQLDSARDSLELLSTWLLHKDT